MKTKKCVEKGLNMSKCAVILAGGQANRMGGVDKGRLMLGDQSLIQRVIGRITPQVDAVVLNANGDPGRFDDLGLPVVADSIPDYAGPDRKSTRLNSSHVRISYAVFCL